MTGAALDGDAIAPARHSLTATAVPPSAAMLGCAVMMTSRTLLSYRPSGRAGCRATWHVLVRMLCGTSGGGAETYGGMDRGHGPRPLCLVSGRARVRCGVALTTVVCGSATRLLSAVSVCVSCGGPAASPTREPCLCDRRKKVRPRRAQNHASPNIRSFTNSTTHAHTHTRSHDAHPTTHAIARQSRYASGSTKLPWYTDGIAITAAAACDATGRRARRSGQRCARASDGHVLMAIRMVKRMRAFGERMACCGKRMAAERSAPLRHHAVDDEDAAVQVPPGAVGNAVRLRGVELVARFGDALVEARLGEFADGGLDHGLLVLHLHEGLQLDLLPLVGFRIHGRVAEQRRAP